MSRISNNPAARIPAVSQPVARLPLTKEVAIARTKEAFAGGAAAGIESGALRPLQGEELKRVLLMSLRGKGVEVESHQNGEAFGGIDAIIDGNKLYAVVSDGGVTFNQDFYEVALGANPNLRPRA